MISRWVVMRLQRTLGQTSRGPLQTLGVIHTPAMKGLKTETFYKAWFCMILLHIRRLGGGSQIFSYVFATLKSDIFLKIFLPGSRFSSRKWNFSSESRFSSQKWNFSSDSRFSSRKWILTIRFKIWEIKYCSI